jgi:membrane protease YdiL (CAAX protease family)
VRTCADDYVRWLARNDVEKPRRGLVLREVGRFYALAFALSWAGWMPALLRQWRVPGFESVFWLGLTALGAAGPAIAAWIVDRRTFRSFRIAVGWRWLLAAALIPAGLLLMTNALSWALLGLHPRSAVRGWQILWITAMAVGANVWEEVGWRAYALRRLENVMQPWLAALIVGILWAGWHVPLFLSDWSGMTQIPFGWWALRIIATSVIMAWLYNRTGGSLWAVTVFHVGSNVWAAWTGVLVALDRGHRSVDGGGFFAFAYKRTARPVTLFQRVRWGRGSDWYRYVGFSVVDSPPDEKRVSPETAPALGRHPAHGRFPSCISYLWNESRQRAQTFPKKSERPAEKPHRPSPTRLSIAGEPL